LAASIPETMATASHAQSDGNLGRKWIGVQCFALLSLLLGLLVGLGLAAYLDADFEYGILGISVAQTAAAILLYSGLAIAISTLVTPGIAGAVAILIAFLPDS
jgi:hypothetical protein